MMDGPKGRFITLLGVNEVQMIFRKLFIFLSIYLASFAVCADSSFPELRKLASQYVEAVNNGEYEKAALKLYYPASLQGLEKENEVQDISKSFSIFAQEFGQISNLQPGETGKYYSAMVMTGSLEFWSDKMETLNLKYHVNYTKHDQGFLVFNFSEIEGVLILRSVEYGLPASKANVKNTITKVLKRLATNE
jgi:hypothetical protein